MRSLFLSFFAFVALVVNSSLNAPLVLAQEEENAETKQQRTSSTSQDKSQKKGGDADGAVPIIEIKDFESTLKNDKGLWLIRLDNKPEKIPQDVVFLAKLTEGLYKVGFVDTSNTLGQELAQRLLPKKKNIKKQQQPITNTHIIFSDGQTASLVEDSSFQGLTNAVVKAAPEVLQRRLSAMGFGPKTQSSSSSSSSPSSKPSSSSSSSSSKSSPLVVLLNSKNFKEKVYQSSAASLVAFTAPWCGHCQRLQPEYEQAAKLLSKKGVGVDIGFFGWVDATADTSLGSQFQVKGYPTIYFFPPTAKSPSDAIPYQGDRAAKGLWQYMMDQLDKYGALKIPQLVSSNHFKDQCGGLNHICVLTVLPHLADTTVDARNAHLKVIQSVAKKFPSSSFLWSEGTVQPALEEAFGLSFGFPAVVAYTIDRQAFAVMRGSFSEKSMTTFLHSIISGKIAIDPIAATPPVETVTAWDGKPWQGATDVYEDEIPLSEIMGDEF